MLLSSSFEDTVPDPRARDAAAKRVYAMVPFHRDDKDVPSRAGSHQDTKSYTGDGQYSVAMRGMPDSSWLNLQPRVPEC